MGHVVLTPAPAASGSRHADPATHACGQNGPAYVKVARTRRAVHGPAISLPLW
jgi:hypothetical protein